MTSSLNWTVQVLKVIPHPLCLGNKLQRAEISRGIRVRACGQETVACLPLSLGTCHPSNSLASFLSFHPCLLSGAQATVLHAWTRAVACHAVSCSVRPRFKGSCRHSPNNTSLPCPGTFRSSLLTSGKSEFLGLCFRLSHSALFPRVLHTFPLRLGGSHQMETVDL